MSSWAALFRAHLGVDTTDTTDTTQRKGISVDCVDCVTGAKGKIAEPPLLLLESDNSIDHTEDRDSFDERAAIIEHDAGVPRDWAEGFARLNPGCPPRDIPATRWREIINGIGVFLDQWAAQAIAMGWGAADIFGADATRPEVTWLNSGPLWRGDGARVVEVHPHRIVFETRGGVRQSHYRRAHLRRHVLPWEHGQ